MNNLLTNVLAFVFIIILVLLQGCSETKLTTIPQQSADRPLYSQYTCTDLQMDLVTYLIEQCVAHTPNQATIEFCSNRAFVKACEQI